MWYICVFKEIDMKPEKTLIELSNYKNGQKVGEYKEFRYSNASALKT